MKVDNILWITVLTMGVLKHAKAKNQQTTDFTIDQNHVVVYTDGAVVSNGATKLSAGYGVYFGENHPLNMAGTVVGRVTNNHAEIMAAIHAIRQAKYANLERLCIRTDCKFLIQCIEDWLPKWKLSGWKRANGRPVKNQVELQELDAELHGLAVKLEYVSRHQKLLGNERADAMARQAARVEARYIMEEKNATKTR